MTGHPPHSHAHAGHAHDAQAWEARMAWYDRLVDLLEPEMRHATDALLDAVDAGPGTRLLDLACGAGHTTDAARLRGANAVGIDMTRGMIAAAKRRFPQAKFLLGDMLAPPPGPWDAITCRLGAHHVDPRWVQAAYEVLAPGGRLAIAEMAPTTQEAEKNGMKPPSYWARLFETVGLADVTTTTRMLRLGTLTAHEPAFIAMRAQGHGSQFHDGPIHIITGAKPLPPS